MVVFLACMGHQAVTDVTVVMEPKATKEAQERLDTRDLLVSWVLLVTAVVSLLCVNNTFKGS